MSQLPSNYKRVMVPMLILLASCSRPAKSPAENAALEKAPKTFATPADAGAALLAAAQSGDRSAWLAIFGPEGRELLFTGDASQDAASMRDFATAYSRMNRWGDIKAGGRTLYIGPDNYAFPIPLGQNAAGQWYFDTAAGKDEITARRIGRDELTAIEACDAVAKTQKQKQPAGALGRLGDFGKAVTSNTGAQPAHFSGYHYRMGAKSSGFAILAYPAEYRNSGIMTFIAGKDGTVYQKDLGEKTADAALAITEFNPADGWSPAMPHSGTASRSRQ